MNTKPGIPDHFTIHDVRDAMHPVDACPIPDLSIDIGEGGRAAVQGVVNEIAAKVAPGHEPPTVVWTKPDDGRNGLPLGFFDDSPFVYEFTDANGPMRCHPASGVGPLTLHVKRPHVATLPDGRAVNLPAGTVLREGMTWEGPPADPLRDLCDAFKANPDPATAAMITKLREQVDRGASPLLAQAVLREGTDKCIGCNGTGRVETPEDGPEKCHDCYGDGRESTALLAQALDLLRRARPRLVDEPESKRLDGEIVAFLAGMPIVSEGSREEPPAGACVRITWAETAKGMRALLAQGMPPADVLAMYLGTETPGLRPSSK